MKKLVLLSNLLILFLITVSLGQENKPTTKRIAFYNSYQFADKKNGVERYAQALELLGYICIFEKDEEKRKELYMEAYKRHTKLAIEPIKNEIYDLLKQIEIQNNITLFDIVELGNKNQLLTFDQKSDISQNLITILNDRFKTKSKPNFTLNLPEQKFAKINTELFFDEKTGIKSIAAKSGAIKNLLTKETGTNPSLNEIQAYFLKVNTEFDLTQIGVASQDFAMKNGYTAIFNSSKNLPAELENFQITDITNDFISYYNQLNP